MTDCIFCKIIKGEIPSERVYEGKTLIAIRDINPMKPTHVLFMPRDHVKDVLGLASWDHAPAFQAELNQAIAEVVAVEGIENSGFSLITNCGSDGGQTVFHLHFHLMGGSPIEWAKLAQ
ncbi:MAG: histidine triad nucleotide-binding protein [Eubacteriales bacterium]|nr:histidine triad nucleotide-binding protein [Eubacteriales bacterium]